MGASVIMAPALYLVAPLSTKAAVPTTPTGGLTSLIKGLTMTPFGSSEDLLVKEEPTRFGSSASLNIDLEYDPVAGPEINQGDTLSIQLVPVDEEKDFIWIPSVDSGVQLVIP